MGREANEGYTSPTKFKLNNKFAYASRILIKFTVFTFVYSSHWQWQSQQQLNVV